MSRLFGMLFRERAKMLCVNPCRNNNSVILIWFFEPLCCKTWMDFSAYVNGNSVVVH